MASFRSRFRFWGQTMTGETRVPTFLPGTDPVPLPKKKKEKQDLAVVYCSQSAGAGYASAVEFSNSALQILQLFENVKSKSFWSSYSRTRYNDSAVRKVRSKYKVPFECTCRESRPLRSLMNFPGLSSRSAAPPRRRPPEDFSRTWTL